MSNAPPFSIRPAELRDVAPMVGLIRELALAHWADPMRSRPNEINTLWGGRGVYFDDPDGHSLEIITAIYGALEEAGHGQ